MSPRARAAISAGCSAVGGAPLPAAIPTRPRTPAASMFMPAVACAGHARDRRPLRLGRDDVLEAFMTGGLFPPGHLDEMQRRWTPIFRPLEYGVGIMRFALPRYYTLFGKVAPTVGHSGKVLYYVPALDLYVSGTVNQIEKRSLSSNLLTRLVMACRAAWRR